MNKIQILTLIVTVLAMLVCALISTATSTHKLNKRDFKKAGGPTWASRFMIGVQEALVLPATLWRQYKYKTRIVYGANIAEGTHAATKSFLSAAAITTRHLLYKMGADDNHVAVCGASDVPVCTVADEATAAEELITGEILGKGSSKRMVASEAITRGTIVYVATGGKIASTGTYVVGIALNSVTTDGDIVEVADTVTAAISAGIAATLYDAHTILYATTDNTPVALTIGASTIVGRKASGNIVALTGAETRTIISGVSNITATPVAAAGSTVSDAGQLAASAIVFITSDSAAKGVKLPTGVAGMEITVSNGSSTACELYAASGGTVNGLSADASVVVPASKGVRCFCSAADTWIVYDLPAKATAS